MTGASQRNTGAKLETLPRAMAGHNLDYYLLQEQEGNTIGHHRVSLMWSVRNFCVRQLEKGLRSRALLSRSKTLDGVRDCMIGYLNKSHKSETKL